jgi:hypothetical protein
MDDINIVESYLKDVILNLDDFAYNYDYELGLPKDSVNIDRQIELMKTMLIKHNLKIVKAEE